VLLERGGQVHGEGHPSAARGGIDRAVTEASHR
jgi:hypothetical protein